MSQQFLSADDIISVTQCVTNMGLYADLHEWDRLKSLYHSPFELDYRTLYGGQVTEIDPESAIDTWEKQLIWWDATQHIITNFEVTWLGENEAQARSHVRAFHLKGNSPWIIGGLYTHILKRKSSGGWAITRQQFINRYEQNHEGEDSPKMAWMKATSWVDEVK